MKYKVTTAETAALIENAPFNYPLDFELGNGVLVVDESKCQNGTPYEMQKLAELRGVDILAEGKE